MEKSHFLSIMIYFLTKNRWREMECHRFSAEVMNLFVGKKDGKNYLTLMNEINNGVEIGGILYTNILKRIDNYIIGEKCYGYNLLDNNLLNALKNEEELEGGIWVKELCPDKLIFINYIKKWEVVFQSWLNRTREKTYSNLNEMHKEYWDLNMKGLSKISYPSEHLDLLSGVNPSTFMDIVSKRGKVISFKHSRIYHTFSNIPKVAREKLMISGKGVVECDIKAAYPQMMMRLSVERGWLSKKSDLHKLVMKHKGDFYLALCWWIEFTYDKTYTRDEIKKFFNAFLNDKEGQKFYNGVYGYIKEFLDEYNPGFLINLFEPNTIIWKEFSKMEFEIMSGLIKKLDNENIPSITIHDCILGPKTNKFKRIVEEYFNMLGIEFTWNIKVNKGVNKEVKVNFKVEGKGDNNIINNPIQYVCNTNDDYINSIKKYKLDKDDPPNLDKSPQKVELYHKKEEDSKKRKEAHAQLLELELFMNELDNLPVNW